MLNARKGMEAAVRRGTLLSPFAEKLDEVLRSILNNEVDGSRVFTSFEFRIHAG